jgi:protein phosphatase 2C
MPTNLRVSSIQVANHCRERIHSVLIEELGRAEAEGIADPKKQWERAFVDCFACVDAEVGGNTATSSQPVAPDTVGSTAVVAVLCSSHIIVANCGDSRAVLCRGKQPLALSSDHKV